jgi:hypothetical protein
MLLATPPQAHQAQLWPILLEQAVTADSCSLPPAVGGRAFALNVLPEAHQQVPAQLLQALNPFALGQGHQDTTRQGLVPTTGLA